MTSPSVESLAAHLKLAGHAGDVPAGWEATLAERLRDLLRNRDSELKPAAIALREAVRRLVAEMEPASRSEILGQSSIRHPEVKKAYRLGQLDLAHLVLAQSASKRADRQFHQTLENPTYRRCIQEMYNCDRSTSELARLGGRTNEQTSRTLSVLRKAGVSDFRKVSTQVFNFLTPAARQAFKKILDRECSNLAEETVKDSAQAAHQALADIMRKLDPVLQSTPTFGPISASEKALFV